MLKMKTLHQFVEEACQELDAGWRNLNGITILDKPLKDFLRAKLLQSAELTASEMKRVKRKKGQPLATEDIYYDIGFNAALTEIETKKKAWFD